MSQSVTEFLPKPFEAPGARGSGGERRPLKIAGKLGLEGESFVNAAQKKAILEDLKQALHIKSFIRESILQLEKSFCGRAEELLREFCEDAHIFRELEVKNQLDIKGGLTRLLEQLPQGLPLLQSEVRRPPGAARLGRAALRGADQVLPVRGALQGGVREHFEDGEAVGPFPVPHEDAGARGGAAGLLQE